MKRITLGRALWPALLTTVSLAACGGGGGDDDGASKGATVLSFSSAPTLAAAPTPLPVSSGRNRCEGLRFGGRDIENLSVPDGATCVLDPGVVIDGNLELGTGSRLYASGIRVGGNVQGQRAAIVLLEGSTVGGSVQLDIGGDIAVRGVTVNGSIQLVSNSGAIDLLDNRVGSDIQVFQNRGGAALNRNTADGNLQCKENAPAPTGSGNRAASKEDQCSAL